jgi:hypothetical protein
MELDLHGSQPSQAGQSDEKIVSSSPPKPPIVQIPQSQWVTRENLLRWRCVLFIRCYSDALLGLTAIVGDECSFINAVCRIVALAAVTWARARSERLARVVRDHAYKTLQHIDSAIPEPNGEISVVPIARSGWWNGQAPAEDSIGYFCRWWCAPRKRSFAVELDVPKYRPNLTTGHGLGLCIP